MHFVWNDMFSNFTHKMYFLLCIYHLSKICIIVVNNINALGFRLHFFVSVGVGVFLFFKSKKIILRCHVIIWFADRKILEFCNDITLVVICLPLNPLCCWLQLLVYCQFRRGMKYPTQHTSQIPIKIKQSVLQNWLIK